MSETEEKEYNRDLMALEDQADEFIDKCIRTMCYIVAAVMSITVIGSIFIKVLK